jgi:hypothetical protein
LQKYGDASGEVSFMETGEKNLKRTKAFEFRGFVNINFSHDAKTAFAELPRCGTSPESSRKGGGGIYRPLA